MGESEDSGMGDPGAARVKWVLDHVALAIERAKLLPEPFSHCFVQNLFPELYYREMLAMLPADEDWAAEDYPNLVLHLDLPLDHLEPKCRDFWLSFFSEIMPTLSRLIALKFESSLSLWLKRLVSLGILSQPARPVPGPDSETTVFCRILKREPEFRIQAHSHHVVELLDNLIYLADDERDLAMGTAIYKLKQEKKIAIKDLFAYPTHDEDEVEMVGLIPYLPNSMISWPNTPDSLHGRPPRNGYPYPAWKRYIFSGIELNKYLLPEAREDERTLDLPIRLVPYEDPFLSRVTNLRRSVTTRGGSRLCVLPFGDNAHKMLDLPDEEGLAPIVFFDNSFQQHRERGFEVYSLVQLTNDDYLVIMSATYGRELLEQLRQMRGSLPERTLSIGLVRGDRVFPEPDP